MPLDAKVWLPPFQFMMQTMSVLYPKHPNDTTKKKYYAFIQNLGLFISERPLGADFLKLLDQYPVTPYLSSRLSFMKWVHFINNKLLLKLGKKEVTFYDSLEEYYNAYKPKEMLDKEKFKHRRQYIQFAFILTGICLILYFKGC